MQKIYIVLFAFFCFPLLAAHTATADRYDVIWESPSKDSSGTMPLGNGDIGLNVWAEENGYINFYISKTDSWSENARLLKLGLVHLSFTPNPFDDLKSFKHHLSLHDGTMIISAANDSQEITTKLWVDAHSPVIRIEMQGDNPFNVQASFDPWRTKKRVIADEQELHSAYGLVGAPFKVEVTPDTVKENGNQILWYHRNERSIWPLTVCRQGLTSLVSKFQDPLMNRTFGGLMQGKDFVLDDSNQYTLKSSESASSHQLAIHVLTSQTETADGWINQINQNSNKINNQSWKEAYKKHTQYWNNFWNRSFIHLTSSNNPESEEFIVSRGYTLQRFISACAGRGDYPIKFNGSIFTVDVRKNGEQVYDADYRRWGGPYWFQNTRLCYWPMLKSGDFELMEPLFKMYLDALPFSKERTRIYHDHPGAFYPETMYFWGSYTMDNYGWDRKDLPVHLIVNRYIRYHFNGAIELLAMMIDHYLYTQDKPFLQDTLYPFAEPVLRFFDEHYPRNEKGKFLIKPSQALETWQKATNPMPEIAGLEFTTRRLLNIDKTLPQSLQTLCERIQSDLPELPKKIEDGDTFLLPAEKFDELRNSENPELYAIFPFRLYGLERPDLQIARETFERRRVKRTGGWTQDPIQAAYLGLVEAARDYTVQNFSNKNEGSRFPAFWGPNFDWIPDQDHGNVSMIALQSMLMQNVGGRILLFPAWPNEWDVEFKLHAPANTIIEGTYKNGELQNLSVTPESRREDVEIMLTN